MLKALTLGLQFAAALASLAFSIGIFITGMLNRLLEKKIQLRPELQEALPASKPISTTTLKATKVETFTTPQTSAPTPSPKTPSMILNARDHQIYLTANSQLIFPHPKAGVLLRELDKILYVAAHRNGTPFTMPTELDASAASLQPKPDFAHIPEDDEFLPTSPVALPSPDGHLWHVSSGKHAQRLGTRS